MRYFVLELLARIPLLRALPPVKRHVRRVRLMRDFVMLQGSGVAKLKDVLPFYQADYLTQLLRIGNEEDVLGEKLADLLEDEESAKALRGLRRNMRRERRR